VFKRTQCVQENAMCSIEYISLNRMQSVQDDMLHSV